jgi:hypothetical protein
VYSLELVRFRKLIEVPTNRVRGDPKRLSQCCGMDLTTFAQQFEDVLVPLGTEQVVL